MALVRLLKEVPVRWILCSALGAASMLAPWLRAADNANPQSDPSTLKNLTLEELSQLEVTTPSKQPTKASRTPAAIYVITAEDIRRSGFTVIPEVLRLAPGVEVARIDGSKWSVGIRGFGSRLARSVLVMIDGRTVYTPLFAGTYWEVQDTLLEDIDRIEVIRGPGGTIWGPNAVNGIINIITKSAKDTHGVLVSAGGGNELQGFLNVRAGGGRGNLNYRAYWKGYTRGPEFHSDGRNFDDWRGMQGGFRADWTPSQRDTVSVQGDLYQEATGQQVNVNFTAPPFRMAVEGNSSLTGGNFTARWERVNSSSSGIRVQTYFDRTTRFEADFGEARNTFDIDALQYFRPLERHEISWGVGARTTPTRNVDVSPTLHFDPLKRTDYLLTAFLQDEITLLPDRLSLTLGCKFLRTNFTPFGPEPSIRLTWTPNSKQTVWAAFTHALRTPSDAEENFYLTGPGDTNANPPSLGRFYPNPAFASEQMNGYELGYRNLIRSNLFVDVTGFYNHYTDLFSQELAGPIFFESSPGVPHSLIPLQFRNSILGNTKGLEIAPEWRATKYWRLRGSYSHLHMNLDTRPGAIEFGTAAVIAHSSPEHQVVVQSSIDFGKRFQFDVDYRYVSELTAQAVPAYHTGDARLGWRINDQWEFSLVGRNLLQPYHPEFAGDPSGLVGIRRSAYVKLTWSK